MLPLGDTEANAADRAVVAAADSVPSRGTDVAYSVRVGGRPNTTAGLPDSTSARQTFVDAIKKLATTPE